MQILLKPPKPGRKPKISNPQITARLRSFLRLFTGCPRGFYGFSTATDFSTGCLRLKTWFWSSWSKTTKFVKCIYTKALKKARSQSPYVEANVHSTLSGYGDICSRTNTLKLWVYLRLPKGQKRIVACNSQGGRKNLACWGMYGIHLLGAWGAAVEHEVQSDTDNASYPARLFKRESKLILSMCDFKLSLGVAIMAALLAAPKMFPPSFTGPCMLRFGSHR